MAKRKNISKKIRFEVFKRDGFSCQYCGEKSPDVVLVIDHIMPVSKGGTNNILNLITSCFDCNSGKSNIEISDNSVITKQRKQLDDLQERREQLKMMFEWQEGLLSIEQEAVERICSLWAGWSTTSKIAPLGEKAIKKLLKSYGVERIINAMKIALDTYEDTGTAFKKIGAILKMQNSDKNNPHLKDAFYIRGIIKNRFPKDYNSKTAIIIILKAIELNVDIDSLTSRTKTVPSWDVWKKEINHFIDSHTPRTEN